jgi:hypothetical protein
MRYDDGNTHCLVFEPEGWIAFKSIEAILFATFEEPPVESDSWEPATAPFPWNTY